MKSSICTANANDGAGGPRVEGSGMRLEAESHFGFRMDCVDCRNYSWETIPESGIRLGVPTLLV